MQNYEVVQSEQKLSRFTRLKTAVKRGVTGVTATAVTATAYAGDTDGGFMFGSMFEKFKEQMGMVQAEMVGMFGVAFGFLIMLVLWSYTKKGANRA